MSPDTLALMIPIVALLIPVVAIITRHQQKLAEMRYQGGGAVESNVLASIQALRNEMQDLRDTTTRYDLSFDAALQRIESRVGNLENRVVNLEQANVHQATH